MWQKLHKADFLLIAEYCQYFLNTLDNNLFKKLFILIKHSFIEVDTLILKMQKCLVIETYMLMSMWRLYFIHKNVDVYAICRQCIIVKVMLSTLEDNIAIFPTVFDYISYNIIWRFHSEYYKSYCHLTSISAVQSSIYKFKSRDNSIKT